MSGNAAAVDTQIRALRSMASEMKIAPFNCKDVKTWKIEMRAKLNATGLLPLATGKERFMRDWSNTTKALWDQRWATTHVLRVAALHDEHVGRFEEAIETGDPIWLWTSILNEFDGMPTCSRIVVNIEMIGRYLKSNERMNDYVTEMVKLRDELRKAGEDKDKNVW